MVISEKKSTWGFRKQKIHLEQKVRTLEEIASLKENCYPFAFVLNKEDWEAFEEGTLEFVTKEYYQKLEESDSHSLFYVVLNLETIGDALFQGTAYLDSIRIERWKRCFCSFSRIFYGSGFCFLF